MEVGHRFGVPLKKRVVGRIFSSPFGDSNQFRGELVFTSGGVVVFLGEGFEISSNFTYPVTLTSSLALPISQPS